MLLLSGSFDYREQAFLETLIFFFSVSVGGSSLQASPVSSPGHMGERKTTQRTHPV